MHPYVLVIDSSNVLQLRTSLSVAWCRLRSRKHVVFNVEDRILVENLYKFKDYRAKKIVIFLTKVGPLMV